MRLALFLAGLIWFMPQAVMAIDTGSSWNSGSTPDNQNMTAARKAIDDGDYLAALENLYKAVETQPESADVHNLLGYSHRKLGNRDRAFAYYQTALSLDPKHRGANAYLGELYLQLGDLESAEGRLAILDDLCTFGCEEYTVLKRSVADFKARGGPAPGNP